MTLLVSPFPEPGRGLKEAYRDLELAQQGTEQHRQALGDLDRLPRPWVPDTLSRSLRRELWAWLEEVVPWLNEHYTWEIGTAVPVCWDRHPHLVLELATVTDLRYRAGRSLTGDGLEDWHRYCLPAFLDRMTSRLRSSCESSKHVSWPGRPRQARFETERAARADRSAADVARWMPAQHGHIHTDHQGLHADPQATDFKNDDPTLDIYRVDPTTGEVLDDGW